MIDVPTVTAYRHYVPTTQTTATKTTTSLLETPQSVSVVTHDQLGLLQTQTLEQALHYTSGVVTGSFGNDTRFDWLTLRGFTPPRYLDGLPLPTSVFAQSRLDLYDMNEVQVLKGPSSVLYGAIPPGGLVNEVSKRPQLTPFADVNLQLGSYDFRQAAVDAGAPLDANGKILGRITGVFRDANSETDYVNQQLWNVAPSLAFLVDPDTTLTILSHYQHDRTNTSNQFLPIQGTLLPDPYGQLSRGTYLGEPNHDRFSRTDYDVGYLLDHRVNDSISLHQSARYSDVNVGYDTIYGDGFVTDPVTGLPSDYRTVAREAYLVQEDTRNVVVDTNAEIRVDTGPLHHDILLGVNYIHNRDDYGVGFGSAPSIDAYTPQYGQQFAAPAISTHTITTQDDVGEYAQDQIRLGRFVGTLSGREDEVSTVTRNIITPGTIERNDAAFSWRAGLTYLTGIGLAPYVSYSRSFVPTTGTTFGGTTFAPTTGSQYEVGAKYQLGRRTLVTGALFQLTENNALTNDPLHPFYSVQQGQERVRGIELEDATRLSDALSINAAYTYTDAVVTQSNAPADLGERVTLVPRHQVSVLGDYTFPRGRLAGLGFGAGVRYVGAVFGDAANLFRTPSYTLVDAIVHYDTPGYRLAVNASNLGDERFLTACYSSAFCYYGPGRSILATLTLKLR